MKAGARWPHSLWSEISREEGRAGSQTLRFPTRLGWAAVAEVREQHKRRRRHRERLPPCVSGTSLLAGLLLASPFG